LSSFNLFKFLPSDLILIYDERLITFKNCHKVDTHFNPWNRAQRSMAHPLRAASRLVAMAQMPKPLTTGIISAVPRNFGTTSLRTSNYQAIEGKRGSLYHLIWKRKFTWLFALGGGGFLVYELMHPDKANRTAKMKNEWAHLAGGAYDPNKPQNSNLKPSNE